MQDFDIIVLGGGPGGYLAAERLGSADKKVALVEAVELGGTCLNVGCIPTKTLLNSAKTYIHAKESSKFGVATGEVSYNWQIMQDWKAKVVKTLVSEVSASEKKSGVTVLKGYAQVSPGRIVHVGQESYSCEQLIIATGSTPVMPNIPGVTNNSHLVDSTGALSLSDVPQRLTVIGGGVIGIEFANLYNILGSKVTVIEMMDEIVPNMDPQVATLFRQSLAGIHFELGAKVTQLDGGTVHFVTKDGTQSSIESDVILMAVGRRPAVLGWGAETIGLDYSSRGIIVDERLRTNLANVWAIGDVTGRGLLAHAAYRMAEVVVANILDPEAHHKGEVMRWHTVPWVVYSIPEAAGVGLTQPQAVSKNHRVLSATAPGYLSGRFIAENGLRAKAAAKVIVDADTRIVLGIHVLAPYASEMIWGASAVLENELTLDELRQLVIPHPTVSELIREAAWAIKD